MKFSRVPTVLLLLSIAANSFFAYQFFTAAKSSVTEKQADLVDSEQFPYLSKRIFTESPNDIIVNFIPLRLTLKEYVEKQEGKVGVYFEYLPSGTSIGVNDRGEVKLASLSKVPLVMSIYKKIERGKMSKADTLTIKKEHLDQKFGTLWKRGEGTKLSVEELIQLTLVESDNTAYNALFDTLTLQEVNEVYDGLDIQLVENEGYLLVSPKSYSSIFRSLYLSSFLSKENSNLILQILTKTPFNDEIAAGVPSNIQVAHKIGVFETLDAIEDVFIDCGIIYVPNRPYILCVFVQDTNQQAQKHMSYISKMIYGYIVVVKGGN